MHLKQILQSLHFLSLDVVAGAVATSWAFWQLPNATEKADAASLVALACVTWSIYILDRLADLRLPTPINTPRHRFHAQHETKLKGLLVLLAIVAGYAFFQLPAPVRNYGFLLGLSVVGYFLLLKRWKGQRYQWTKEFFTAFFYTAAVVGVPYAAKSSLTASMWVLAIGFFFIVWQSVIIFSLFEFWQGNSTSTLATCLGQHRTSRLIRLITGGVFFLYLVLFSGNDALVAYFAYLQLFMLAVQSALPIWRSRLLPQNRYRWVGEAIFLLPLLLLFFL